MADGLTREQVSSEALNILKAMRDNHRSGRSNKLADVKSAFEHAVSIEFDTYFFFLRKHHFIGMDREACLHLTAEGEKVVDGERRDRFSEVVEEYFGSRISAPDLTASVVISEPMVAGASMDEANVATDSFLLDSEYRAPSTPAAIPPPPPSSSPLATGRAERQRPRPPGAGAVARAEREPELSASPTPRAARPEGEPRSGESRGQEMDLRYVKYDAMGQGPLGTVYRGRHTALGLDVCVKELKDIFGYFSFLQRGDVIKRLKRELCAQALVRHPGVLAVLDQNCDVARPYFVVELCAGGSLRQRLDAADGNGLPAAGAVRIFLQLCYALRAAHQQNLTHANLKPENVLFDHFGNALLADFGLSRVIEVDAARGMPQVFVGTGGMGYMSPEQLARSNKDQGPASDVYSLGILLYEMFTGQLPGRRSPLPSTVNPEAPKELDAIFDKMTQDRRADRYPDLDAVLSDFYAAFKGGPYLMKGDLILSSEGIAPQLAQEQV